MLVRGVALPILAFAIARWSGLVFFLCCQIVYYRVLKVVFKMDRLAALDEFFMLDNEMNRANIITVVKTDKVPDYPRLRKIIIDLAIQHPRLKHRLTKFMGEHFFIELTPSQLEIAIDKCFIRNDSLHTDDDIAEFIAKE